MDEVQVTTLRTTWDFTYATADVLAAAEQRVMHHKSRRDWWEQEMKAAEMKLKEKGFEYREEQQSLGAQVVIVGDPQLANRASHCRRKIDEHQRNAERYESWVRALAGREKRDRGSTLVLKIDDIDFFGL